MQTALHKAKRNQLLNWSLLCDFSFLSNVPGEVLAQAAQGGGGVTTLEVFKKHGNVALRNLVSGHGEVGLRVGFVDLNDLFQP